MKPIFEIGQIVEIVDNTCGHYFEIGDKVRVRTVWPDGEPDTCESLDKSDYWHLDSDDVRHIQGVLQ